MIHCDLSKPSLAEPNVLKAFQS